MYDGVKFKTPKNLKLYKTGGYIPPPSINSDLLFLCITYIVWPDVSDLMIHVSVYNPIFAKILNINFFILFLWLEQQFTIYYSIWSMGL